MKIQVVLPEANVRDAELNKLITYLKQGSSELEPGLGSIESKNITDTINLLKTVAARSVDSYSKANTLAKSANSLANSIFLTARYRDIKYAAAGRKYLFGLGYHNAMVHSTRTVFAKTQLDKNAK